MVAYLVWLVRSAQLAGNNHKLLVRLGIDNSLPCELSFFPSSDGTLMDKLAVVGSVKKVASRLNQSLTGHDGRRILL